MKFLPLFLVLIFCIKNNYGQIAPSSCNAPDSIISTYIDDAQHLTLKKIYRNNLTYQDSIEIPQSHSDTILNALIAVYNATSLPARDTVISMYNIHTFQDIAMNSFILAADSNLAWMQALKAGNLNTGNSTIDDVITTYGCTINGFYEFSNSPYNVLGLKTDSNYNILELIQQIDTIVGVYYVEPNGYIGDGGTITDSIHLDHVELTYSTGWGDCPSGCIYERFWKFKVYFDCSVEFTESYGSQLQFSQVSNNSFTNLSISPNPFNECINIKGLNSEGEYNIYNLIGQKVISGTTSENSMIYLEQLPKGPYVLQLKVDGKIKNTKLIKE